MKASSILFMGLAVALISIPPASAEGSKKPQPSPSNWAEAKARWDATHRLPGLYGDGHAGGMDPDGGLCRMHRPPL
jgi:hypothetical protein